MRRRLIWLVTLPLVLAGVTAAHALANAAFGPPRGWSAELLGSSESGAQLTLPLAAIALAVVLVGLIGRATGVWWVPQHSREVATPFACLPPLAFILLEGLEGLARSGSVPWHDVTRPTFLLGLALQLPVALTGYVVARALLRLTDRIRALIVGRKRVPQRRVMPVRTPQPDAPEPRTISLGANYGRAPPAAAAATS